MKYGPAIAEYDECDDIRSIMMGDGSVRISGVTYHDDKISGITFSPSPPGTRPGGYGAEHTPFVDMGIYFQLLFDNPVSIDVVIERLLVAKKSLEEVRES